MLEEVGAELCPCTIKRALTVETKNPRQNEV